MPRIREIFGGINTDIYPTRLRSGEADIALNVTVEGGDLKKRAGFAQYEDDVDGAAGGILNMTTVRFGSAGAYLVVKLTSGKLYHRKLTATVATSFTEIATEQTHNASDPGWFFFWDDHLFYFDRGGGTKWRPDNLSDSSKAWKAGVLRCTVGPTLTQAAGGEKEGRYRVYAAYYNSRTEEEGQVSGPVATSVVCQILTSDTKSGLAISNWASINAATDALKYEWDYVKFYCTQGHTEHLALGAGVECFPHKAYDDATVAIDAASAGLNKADHVHDLRERFTNWGGEPPSAAIGCFTGLRAIYGRVYESSTLVPDKMQFSVPFFPCSVPKDHKYTQGGDSKTIEPEPWKGEVVGGMAATAMAYGGGVACAFNESGTWALRSASDKRIFPMPLHPSKGAVSSQSVVGTPSEIHALGQRSWLVIGEGVRDIAQDRFVTTLETIPVAQQGDAVMGYFGFKDQVWCAVTKAAGTVAQRILVWDASGGPVVNGRAMGSLVYYEPSCLSTAGITAMCEVAYSGAEPMMFIGTSTGQILQYPSGDDDNGTAFTAQWRGYFGQERVARDQIIERLIAHSGPNVAGEVTLKWRAMVTAGSDEDQVERALQKDDGVELIGASLQELHGHIFQVEFYSTSEAEAWEIRDLICEFNTTD